MNFLIACSPLGVTNVAIYTPLTMVCREEVIEFQASSPLPSLCSIVSTRSPLSV